MARRSSRFIRPSPRTKMWIGAGVGGTVIAASAKVFVSSLSAGALLLRPFTILRTRMLIHIISDQIAASEAPFGSYGQIVTTEIAVALGVTAIPDPGALTGDPEADWYVHQFVSTSFEFLDATGVAANAGHQYLIDSKAMRKVGPDDDVAGMFKMETGSGGVIVTGGRQLIQLH